ncbi:MAG: hypothetical protein HY607_07545 [Planctomycetes bacterium]|uniref:hypothetical protein n=1 Tax=Candidatus Wunengus californicus TaxID=3367619 RepID=UPI0040261240|nr:hypothetical protein [Planctomycetota bacterium]
MKRKPKDKLVFGHYLAAFVDLLGQRERLRKLNALPSDPGGPEFEEFIKIIKSTIGAVDDLQSTCKEYFEAFVKRQENSIFNKLPGISNLDKTQIKFQHFSDGIVIYTPLRMGDGYSPVLGVYGALAACGVLILLGLAKKRPVRIGVAIGVSAELRDNELYGKAIADAYEAEAYLAKYPRAVVSNEVVNYLNTYINQKCAEGDIPCMIETQIARACQQMLARDFDGRVIVSYLGDFFRNHLMEKIDKKVYELAYDYVEQQLSEHQKNQNSKLAFRYSILHGYFFEHLGENKSTA